MNSEEPRKTSEESVQRVIVASQLRLDLRWFLAGGIFFFLLYVAHRFF